MSQTCSTINCGNPALSGYAMCADCAGQYAFDRDRIERRLHGPHTTTAFLTPTCPIPALTAFTRPSAPSTPRSDAGMQTCYYVMVDPDTLLPVPQEDAPAPLPFHLTRCALYIAIGFVACMVIALYMAMPGSEPYAAAIQTVGTIGLACALMLFGSLWSAGRHSWFHGLPVGEEGEDEG